MRSKPAAEGAGAVQGEREDDAQGGPHSRSVSDAEEDQEASWAVGDDVLAGGSRSSRRGGSASTTSRSQSVGSVHQAHDPEQGGGSAGRREMDGKRSLSTSLVEQGRERQKKSARTAQQTSLTSFFASANTQPSNSKSLSSSSSTDTLQHQARMKRVPSETDGAKRSSTKSAAAAWSNILSMRPKSNANGGSGGNKSGAAGVNKRKEVAAPSYLSAKEQKAFLSTVDEAPLCLTHREPAVQRVVQKSGANLGRKFWVCARPNGEPGHAMARCNFFQWA